MKRKISALALGISMVMMSSIPSFAMSDIGEHWAKSSIEKLVKEEVVNGYDDNTFRPDKKVTREEVAQLIYKYFNKLVESDKVPLAPRDVLGVKNQ